MPRSVQTLVDLFAEMPGIGPRHARRVVQFLLRSAPSYRVELIRGIETLLKTVRQCSACFRYDDVNEKNLCHLCNDASRENNQLLVVEKDVDVEGVEASHAYRGYYFVLGGLMPLATQRKTSVALRTNELMNRVRKTPALGEVILAFATTPEGDFTSRELRTAIEKEFPNVRVSELGRGLSLGAEIEYADHETLRSALNARR